MPHFDAEDTEREAVVIDSFERPVTIIEHSMSAVVELQTNDAKTLIITHDVLAPQNTRNILSVQMPPGESLEIHGWVQTEHGRRRVPAGITTQGDADFVTSNEFSHPLQFELIEDLTDAMLRTVNDPRHRHETIDREHVRSAALVALRMLNLNVSR